MSSFAKARAIVLAGAWALVWALGALAAASHAVAGEPNRFLKETRDLDLIRGALDRERPDAAPAVPVTGVTVPHHLLAADLVARGIWAASSRRYERVLILSPDHFRALKTPFGITTEEFEAVTGFAAADPPFSASVLAASRLFSPTGSAPNEHGVQSVVPFVRAVFPQARIVAVTAAAASTPAEWRQAAAILGERIGEETLVVQSTDYSHHLPHGEAALRDGETLAAIATGDPEATLSLDQPAHLDSSAAQFIQMALQRDRFGAQPVVIANRNSADYVPGVRGTTSYVVTAFTPRPEDASAFRYDDQAVVYLGGDLLAGRGITPLLLDERKRDAVVDAIRRRTGGAPLVVNLEGVLVDDRPAGIDDLQLVMPERLAIPLLVDLGTIGASLANNHAFDLGTRGWEETRERLEQAGIRALDHGTIADLGAVRILPLTFKRSFFHDHPAIRDTDALAAACRSDAAPPLIAFVHWGDDYSDRPGDFERAAAETFAACGVSAVVGAHSHSASSAIEAMGGGALPVAFSLGNLLFDQKGAGISGALVELRIFRQGTVALRHVPMPNLYASFCCR